MVEPIDESSCYLEIGASSFERLAMHLALLGANFEVSEPPELVEHVRRLAARLRQAAEPRVLV
jgi:predicted DNA-binding transcriptional regulator YafY